LTAAPLSVAQANALVALEGDYLAALQRWPVTEKGPLGLKQRLFCALQPLVILHARVRLGLELALFEFQRSEAVCRYNAEHCRRCKRHRGHMAHQPRNAGARGGCKFKAIGIVRSLHRLRLAGDYGLFATGGVYLTRTEEYRELGEYFEGLHTLAYWGGHFADGNHLSVRHQSRK
jgi:hypothetical protein